MGNQTTYIVRSAINPALILCTDGEFHAECFIGPGTDLSAKIYKTRRNAEKVRGGFQITVESVATRLSRVEYANEHAEFTPRIANRLFAEGKL